MNKYKPNSYYKDIFSINYEKLKESNTKYLLFDLDNTIADNRDKYPSNEVLELFNKLKKDFKIILISNGLKHRVKRFGESLDIKYYYFSCKPYKHTYNKIIIDNNINIEEMVCIGDQIYTDIIGANRLNIKSILVDRISNFESLLTYINRLRENRLIRKYKVFKRGNYYE